MKYIFLLSLLSLASCSTPKQECLEFEDINFRNEWENVFESYSEVNLEVKVLSENYYVQRTTSGYVPKYYTDITNIKPEKGVYRIQKQIEKSDKVCVKYHYVWEKKKQ